ncbi:conserved hypothetical protein [Burkholderia sp. 8Y]|uniref:hypothetical protein n=1 Tax=Burkholderia sp. 8Y TaxID=2653133 RepID=UPI0012F476E9|nr:hypothetical protein [Burkholderia sp. 8Y]VXA95431.1 conserved hypothetical protein [Burkholderia sp. 8Y]
MSVDDFRRDAGAVRMMFNTLAVLAVGLCSAALAVESPVPHSANCPLTSFDAPALNRPKDPRQFGAKCDGLTDDSKAFQKAVNAGDVSIAAGVCIINKTVFVRASHRHIQCAPDTILKRTVSDAESMFVYEASAGLLVGDSIVNCNFVGANAVKPHIDFDAPGHWDIPVLTRDNVSNFLLAGNTFRQFYGQAMFQTTGANGGSGDRIVFNTFKSCPFYGPVFVGHMHGYVAYNKLVDCTAGVENDHPTDNTGGNIFECNRVSASEAVGSITGGVHGGTSNYSGNIVRYNVVVGENTTITVRPREGGRSAQYYGNSCTKGCRVD